MMPLGLAVKPSAGASTSEFPSATHPSFAAFRWFLARTRWRTRPLPDRLRRVSARPRTRPRPATQVVAEGWTAAGVHSMTHTPHPPQPAPGRMAILVTAVWCLLLGFSAPGRKPRGRRHLQPRMGGHGGGGQNAAHQWVGDEPQCLTKHGRRTGPRHSPQQVAALALQQAGAGTVAVAGQGARP